VLFEEPPNKERWNKYVYMARDVACKAPCPYPGGWITKCSPNCLLVTLSSPTSIRMLQAKGGFYV
jgi:hypothetical protein